MKKRKTEKRCCGRTFFTQDIEQIRRLIRANSQTSRQRLSYMVCEALDWRKSDGALKDMSCRVALLRMHREGLIELPPPSHRVNPCRSFGRRTAQAEPSAVLACAVHELKDLRLEVVEREDSTLWNEYIDRYHYLGYKPSPGTQLRYFAYAAELVTEACFVEQIPRDQITLHSDNSSPMKGATMLATLQKLGVIPSLSRPSVNNDNAFSESLFCTLKYRPEYPEHRFTDICQARQWVAGFVEWYNGEHLHSAIRFVTSNDRHEGKDSEILQQRHVVYQAAKQRNPERWSGQTRNWNPVQEVVLNKTSHNDRAIKKTA
jgi:hypothetical protein